MVSLPILSIPTYYAIAAYPHAHAVFAYCDLRTLDNTSPNGTRNKESIKKRLSAQDYAAWERAERCHVNSLENMPLFVGAILAGVLAEQKVGVGSVGLYAFAVGGMAIRTAYTVNYLTVGSSQGWSYVRSVLHNAQMLWAFAVLVRAAVALG